VFGSAGYGTGFSLPNIHCRMGLKFIITLRSGRERPRLERRAQQRRAQQRANARPRAECTHAVSEEALLLRAVRPLTLAEVQRAPGLLRAVKRAAQRR
jgi:hypothetical protein